MYLMLRKRSLVAISALLLSGFPLPIGRADPGGRSIGRTPSLSVELGEPVTYRCTSGRQLVVRYGRLSDGSLSFARLQPPGDEPLTLPQLVAGSGVRFSDEQKWQWWTKGEGGFLQRRDEKGKWKTVLAHCQEEAG